MRLRAPGERSGSRPGFDGAGFGERREGAELRIQHPVVVLALSVLGNPPRRRTARRPDPPGSN